MATYYSWGELMSASPKWMEMPISYDQIVARELIDEGFYEERPLGGSIAKGVRTDPPGGDVIIMTFLQELVFQNPSVRIHFNYLSAHDVHRAQDMLYLEDNAIITLFSTRPPELHCSSSILEVNSYHSGNRNETRIEFSIQPFGATYEPRFTDRCRMRTHSPYTPNRWDCIAMTVRQPDYDGSTHISHYLIQRETTAPKLTLYRVELPKPETEHRPESAVLYL